MEKEGNSVTTIETIELEQVLKLRRKASRAGDDRTVNDCNTLYETWLFSAGADLATVIDRNRSKVGDAAERIVRVLQDAEAEEERRLLAMGRDLRDKYVLHIIDTQATTVLALIEQVAHLTAERDSWEKQAKAHYADYQRLVTELSEARAEVARLTEALAAAEHDHHEAIEARKFWEQQCGVQSERAEAAERDRDAANALLVEGADGHGSNPHWLRKVGVHSPASPRRRRTDGGKND